MSGSKRRKANASKRVAEVMISAGHPCSARQKLEHADPSQQEINVLVGMFNQGRYTEMEAIGREMTVHFPRSGFVWKAVGTALLQQGRNEEALAPLQKAAELSYGDAQPHNNLGNTLLKLDRLSEAEASYRRALELGPDFIEAHYNLGNTLQRLGRLLEAEVCYRHALELNSGLSEAYYQLGNTLMKLARPVEAEASFLRALEIKPDYIDAQSNLLFVYNFLPNQPPTKMLDAARYYGELVARRAKPFKVWNNIPDPARCLRVGLSSGDLRQHPVGNFLESVLAALVESASERMEFFAYPNQLRTDAVTERIKACCRGWHSAVGLSDATLAQRVYDDGIDILIDLSGHTDCKRLSMFAWKPAPIQTAWLGYFATTGVAAMDYLIADPWTLPETEEVYFTEKIWRLPETRLCFTPPDTDMEAATLPALANGYITFGCFNNLAKINDDVVALWARVLASVPGSRIFMKAAQLNEAAARHSTAERFAAHGIGADRMILEGYEPRAKYLASYQQVDITLDPFPFTGATTSAESLWMGVPVLTLAGERFLARQGVGLLMNAGLPEWIATDADDYVALAVSHAGDLPRLAILRGKLRQQVLASPIFDAKHFARHFETALRGMWQKWCDQQ